MENQNANRAKPIMIARSKVGDLFPGLSPKSLANLLCEGRGPKAYRVGRKIYYKIKDLESYLTQSPIQTIGSDFK
jgi:hypothetical protein